MIRALQLSSSWRRLTSASCFRISTKEEFIQRLAGKKYREILGIGEDRSNMFRDKDLHRAYLNQVKKFHSDNVQSEERKREFEEITKCIIAAYDHLKREDENYRDPASTYTAAFYEEEELAQLLFGKSYHEIKYEMYAPGNEAMRTRFLEELSRKKKTTAGDDQKQTPKEQPAAPRTATYTQSVASPQSDGTMGKFLALMVACGLLAIPLLGRGKGESGAKGEGKAETKVREYTEKEYDVMELNAKKILMKPLQQFYNSLLKRRPHMLIYPTGKDPHVLEQLAKFSIAPDIKLYEVPSKYFLSEAAVKDLRAANSVQGVQKYELLQTKPNTLLTLSLQAQRALQNIYVLADDVVSEVRETGRFVPPKVFFKFHGYMMCELRPKPFSSLQCYKNTKYISLFDLYFDYYSPIFFKRDHFREYLAGFEEDAPLKNNRYFGNVYLNHRNLPKQYLRRGEKVAFMRDVKKAYEPSGSLKKTEETYRADWESYYARFEKNWKKYCAHQREGNLIY